MKTKPFPRFATCCAAFLLVAAQSGHAAVRTWNNVATGNWTTGGNWVGGTAPSNSLTTDSALFNDTLLTTALVTVNLGRSIKGLEFAITTSSISFSGAALSLGVAGLNNPGNLGHTFLNSINLSSGSIPIDTDGGAYLFSNATATLAGSGGLTKSGSGGIFLAGPSSHTGDTLLSEGLIQLESFFALQATTLDTGSAGTRSVAFRYTAVEDLENDPGSEGVYHLGGLAGALNLSIDSADIGSGGETGARHLEVGGNSADTTYSGVLSGNGSVTKVGDGRWELTGDNTYTGATVVVAGNLAVNGSTSESSSVTVKTGAILSGIGTVGGDTVIQSGGIHSPGNSPGIQPITGDATYSTGSILLWELGSLVSTWTGGTETDPTGHVDGGGDRGLDFDGVDVGGNISIADGAIFRIVLPGTYSRSNGFWDSRQVWSVFDVTGDKTGFFNTFQIYDADGFVANGNTQTTFDEGVTAPGYFSFQFGSDGMAASSGNLIWSPVPEPSSVLFGLLLGLGLFSRRRN
jgi:autotransporter-associated beta strand protein